MKAALLALTVAIATLQTTPPPQTGQRGQTPTPAAGQPAPLDAEHCKCSVEVTVKNPGTGETISDVEVSLSLPPSTRSLRPAGTGSGNVNTSITTDSSGRALFRNLAEATYSITAQREGYFGAASSSDTYPTQASISVSIGPENSAAARGASEQPTQQITLNMVQGTTIAGRVYDTNHRPTASASVAAYQVTYSEGHRVLTQVGSTVSSNDRGNYRLFGLPPGEYYVRAGSAGSIGPSGGFRGQAGQSGFDRTANRGAGRGDYPSISFYPGTTDAKSAIPIVLRDGESRPGMDIDLQLAATATISGTIVNTILGSRDEPQDPAAQSSSAFYLVPRNPYFLEEPIPISATARVRGPRVDNASNRSETPFEIHEVPPGTYDFYPVYNDTTNTGNRNPSRFSVRTSIEVGTEDVTGVRSVIRPGSTLNGHLTFIGAPPPTAAGRLGPGQALNSIRVLIRRKGNLPTTATPAGTAAAVGGDGKFTVANLINIQYFISDVTPLPDDAYVSDIRQDARSVFDENAITVVSESETNLEVVVNRGGGTIQGIVQDAKHKPVATARVMLIPDMPRRQNVLLYKTATSNATGSFSLNGIAPGNYKLFAWERIPSGAEQNAEFMREYDALGVSVNVSQGLPLANIQVPLIPAKH